VAAESTGVSAEPVVDETAGGSPESAYVIHLGSFRLRREADAEVERLRGLGVDARALHVNVPGKGPWYRVVVGGFASFAEAKARALGLRELTSRAKPNVVGAGGYGAPVPVVE
jgi:cell division septation protein DedD